MATLRLGFLASHGGSNMQAILDACAEWRLDAVPCVVVSNNSESTALQRARRVGIPSYHISGVTHPGAAEDAEILRVFAQHGVDTVILAGYMKKLGPTTLARFRNRIINTHPALLPKYGGKGFYGRRVHQAVIDAGDLESGATVHIVDAEYDSGPILAQVRVPVREDDTVEDLEERVKVAERKLIVETLRALAAPAAATA